MQLQKGGGVCVCVCVCVYVCVCVCVCGVITVGLCSDVDVHPANYPSCCVAVGHGMINIVCLVFVCLFV